MIKHTLAKLAVHLDMDNIANMFMERLYTGQNGRRRFSRRFQILAYHKVSPEHQPNFAPVHPRVFEKYVEFLKRCYRVMDLKELVDRSKSGEVPDRAVALTFDDGYRDNYEFAFPILKKHELPATIFLTTGVIATGRTLWHDRIFDAFNHTVVTSARLASFDIPELRLETPDEKQRSLDLVLDRARMLYGDEVIRFLEELEQTLTPARAPRQEERMLTWPQIREMHKAGIRFGSHTVNHPILSRLPERELAEELRDSKSAIEQQLDSPVDLFAYPNGKAGDYTDSVKKAVRDAGYNCAVTSTLGTNRPGDDLYELKRGQPWQSEIELFRVNFFLQRHELADVRH